MKTKTKTTKNQPLRHISPMSLKEQKVSNEPSPLIDQINFNNVWAIFEKRNKDKWVAYDETKDYFYFKRIFEHPTNLKRKMMLKPSVLKEISDFFYNFKEAPSYITVWDAPINFLKERGLYHRLFKRKALMA